MADSTLSSLSPPPPSDLVPVLPDVNCAVKADSNSTELRVPCSGGPDEKLLNDVNSDVIEASTSKPVDRILNNIDVHQSPAICSKRGHIESISDGKNISISGPNDDISLMNNPNTDGSQSNDTSHLQLTKTNIHSHFNLCSNKADSANVLEEESKNSLSVSSAELNHLPSSVLPTHNASLPCQSAVKINNIDNRDPLLEQLSHPVVMDTKEDSLSVNSIDSLAFTKSGSSLSLDETSSKDSLLTSTESKSMSSSPEADQLPNVGMCLNNFEEPPGPVSLCSEPVKIKMKMSTPELPNKKLPVNTETEANSSCQPSDALNCTKPCQEPVTQDNVAKLVTCASDNPSFSSNSLIVELSGSTPESAAQADPIEASTLHAVNEVDTKCEDGSEANAHPATGQNETINPVTANSSPNLPVENNLSNADKTSSSEEIQLECALELPRCIDSGPVECPENFSQSELCASATRNESENSSNIYEQTKCTLNPENDLENDNVKAVTVPKIILQQEDDDQLSEESHTDKCQASAEVTEEAEVDVMVTEPGIELSTACDEVPSGCNEVSTNEVIQGNIGEDTDFCKMDTDVVDESVQINSLADGKCESTIEKDVPVMSLHSTTKIIAVPSYIPIMTDIIKTSCAGAENFEELPVESNSVCSAAATDRKDAVQLEPAMNTEFMAVTVTAEKPLKAETSSNEVDEANIELSTPESSTDKNVIEKCIFPEISPALKTVSNSSEIMSNEDSSESNAELGTCKSLDEDQSASNELMPKETSHSQDRMHDNNDLAESLACENSNGVLQTVVGGVLQALDVAALEARKKEEEESDNRKLFVGIDEELQDSGNVLSCTTAMHVLENDAEETDGIGGLVINSVVGAFGEAVEESADGDSTTECDGRSKEFADISSPYLNMSKPTFAEECNDEMQSKRPQLENSEAEIQRPVIFKVKPVKGIADSFWDSPKLRAALEEKGTVLLRLCTAEPTEDFEISADFIGVMLDCSEETMYGGSAGHRNGGLDVYSFGPEGGYHPGVYPSYAYQHVRNPGAAEEDFESTEEMEESLDYDGANQTLEWQGSGTPSVEPSADRALQNDEEVVHDLHEITYHDEDFEAGVSVEDHSKQFFVSEMEEKERQYEQHKFSLEQRKSELIRVPPRMCPVCKKGFSKRQQFQKHMKTHRPLLECQYCSFKCRSKKQYATHEARHLKDNPQFICDLCPMKFVLSSQLRAHMGRQHGIFYCPQCGHQSSSFEERNEHMLAEHSIQIKRKKDGYALSECQDDENQEEQNICGTCYKKCRSRALLRIHVAQHFNVDPNQLSDVLEPIRTEDPLAAKQRTEDDFGEDSQDGKVEYTLPSRPLKRSNEYVEDSPPHRKHPRLENVIDESYREHLNDPESYREHLNDPEVNVLARIKPASENALYRCSDCVIDLPSPMSLFLHVVTIHGFLEYDARRRMAQDGDLASNTQQTEAEISQPERDIDPNRNRPGLNLNTHVRQFIPYFCRVCGPQKKFHKYTMYAAHMKTHRKLKKCSECNFSSTQTMRILIHQIKAHKRLFRCPRKCLQLFKTKQELETHKSTIDCKKD